jgi:hypothetical protein
VTDLLCALLRGDAVEWPPDPAAWGATLFECAVDHGVHLLAADRLLREPPGGGCPAEVRARFIQSLREETAVEQVTRIEVEQVLHALRAARIDCLLFKGAALAYTRYANPALRPREDTDLLVEGSEMPAVARVLERLEYRRQASPSGALVSQQVPYSKVDRFGVIHALDVHRCIANPQVFAGALRLAELRPRAVPVPALGLAARAFGPVDALAVACVHRVAHHGDEPRLIWLYDIHLLAGALSEPEVEDFVSLVRARRIRAVCARGCTLARSRFGTVFPPGLTEGLAAGRIDDEPSAEYLGRAMSQLDILLSDLRALDRWADRVRLVREHVFPPASYMRQKYPASSRLWLPALYARRAIAGARRWFRREDGR